VIEDGDAVGGEPDVALEAGRSESQGEGKRVEGVLRGVRAGPPVGERDGRVEERRETLLHHGAPSLPAGHHRTRAGRCR